MKGTSRALQYYADNGDEDTGIWRQFVPENQRLRTAPMQRAHTSKNRTDGEELRNKLISYFNKEGAEVAPWQKKYA